MINPRYFCHDDEAYAVRVDDDISNPIINEIISVLHHNNLSFRQSRYILEKTSEELLNRAKA